MLSAKTEDMIRATIVGLVIGIVIVGVYLYESPSPEISYEREVVETVEVVTPLDVISKAKEELERINTELDVKEQELLNERKAIDAELERLRETRVFFQ